MSRSTPTASSPTIEETYAHGPDRRWLSGELRSDHAGETGAVWVYRGILAVTRDPEIIAFAEEHIATERDHLALIESLIEPGQRSVLVPIWRVSGFVLGALPALLGREAVYQTIEAVETFVDGHYLAQVERLHADGKRELAALLGQCREDEIRHREEAAARRERPIGLIGRAWQGLIGAGSKGAVIIARRC